MRRRNKWEEGKRKRRTISKKRKKKGQIEGRDRK